MSKLVSIIIPIYNRSDYISECLNSVREQTYQNYEVIIVDDGSTDGTVELCRTEAERDDKIVLLCGEHEGVSAARNKALSSAKGEYVFFLDSDDVIHPTLLETLVSSLEDSGVSIAGSYCLSVNEDNWHKVSKRMESDSAPGEVNVLDHNEAMEAFFGGITPISMIGGVLMSRELIGNTRFRTDIYIGEDYYFVYENLIKGASAAFLKQKRYYSRVHKNNSSWDFRFSGFMTRYKRREAVWENEEKCGRNVFAGKQKESAVDSALFCLNNGGTKNEEAKKIRSFLKEKRSVLYHCLSFKYKLLYIMAVYIPWSYVFLVDLKNKLVLLKRKIKSKAKAKKK